MHARKDKSHGAGSRARFGLQARAIRELAKWSNDNEDIYGPATLNVEFQRKLKRLEVEKYIIFIWVIKLMKNLMDAYFGNFNGIWCSIFTLVVSFPQFL
ncbi:unnamed protein product [Linum tenue]|uniref:Uncharacterized protein n=1 Tax=Linum tenue TaxID=586396 RepID=A0AAV0QLH8_9ROSI|nr:unnamed protein product [Linum tenue]